MVILDCIESIQRSNLFPPKAMEVFNFLIENGQCTKDEIELAIWGRKHNHAHSTVLNVHLSQVRKALACYTTFRLIGRPSQDPEHKPIRGRTQFVYKIIELKPPVGEEAAEVATNNPGDRNVPA